MKIVHYTTHFDIGGAGQALARLHRGLIASGHRSEVRFLHGDSQTPSERLFSRRNSWFDRLRNRCLTHWTQRLNEHRVDQSSLFSDRQTPRVRGLYNLLENTDVVQLNWIAQFVSLPRLLKRLPSETPIVWRLPDLNPLTGGCHYSLGCDSMMSGCSGCPQFSDQKCQARVRENWSERSKWFQSIPTHRIHFVAQSHWVADQLTRHPFLSRFGRTVIRNGIDRDRFAPMDKTVARETFHHQYPEAPSLKETRVGLIFATAGDYRKSTDEFLRALVPRLQSHHRLIVVGTREENVVSHHPSIVPMAAMSRDRLPLLYRVADVLLFPHREDNCPNTVLEAHSCGRPVLAMNNSGTTELIQPGVNGSSFPSDSLKDMVDSYLNFSCDGFASPQQIADTVTPMEQAVSSYLTFYKQAIEVSKNA